MRNPSQVLSLFLILGLVAPTTFAADSRHEVIHKSFPAKDGGKLVLNVDQGALVVTGGSGSEVVFEITRDAEGGSERKAIALLERQQIQFLEEGPNIRLEMKTPGGNGWSLVGPRLKVSVHVTVPRNFHLEAQTSGGPIRVSQLNGEVVARTSGGAIRFENVSGRIKGRTSGGSVMGTSLTGPVDVSTSGGPIRMENVSGGPVRAATSGGSIRLTGVAGATEASTSGGSIYVESQGGPLRASTSGGSVEALLRESPAGDVELRSSGGGITLTVPSSAAFLLDASTSGGSVRSEVGPPSASDSDRSSLKGAVQGGGPTVKLRTSGGGIRVRKS